MNHDDYEPDQADRMDFDDDGRCPFCGGRMRYHELAADADVGVDRCDECGYEGCIG